MTDSDIVERLRAITWTNMAMLGSDALCQEAADEIERLRKECFHLAANQCHAGYGGEYGHHRCAEIDRLTKERDEARQRTNSILTEIDCRIEHGAESNGHLEAIRSLFKEATDER